MKNLPLQFALSAKKFLLQRLPEKKPLRSSLLLAFSKNPLCFLSSLFPPEKHHPLPSVTETLHISPQTRPKSNSFLQPQASTTPMQLAASAPLTSMQLAVLKNIS